MSATPRHGVESARIQHRNCQDRTMSVAEALRQQLQDRLDPQRLEIIDESAGHQGHAGWREGGETHFRVVVVAGCFVGRTRIDRQRLVHGAAADLLRDRIHALSITALAPGEADRTG
jgi:BolA protein